MKTISQLQKNFNKNNIRTIIYLMLLGASYSLIANLVVLFFSLDKIFPINKAISDTVKIMPLYQSVLLFGILFPIVEELVFRLLIFGFLRKKTSFIISALISSSIFGIMHGSVIQFVFAFFAGLMFCYIYDKYKTILYTMISHICVNLANMLIYPKIVAKGNKAVGLFILISLAIFMASFYELIVRSNNQNEIN